METPRAIVPAAAAAETSDETVVVQRPRPTLNAVAVRQQLDVQAIHAAALAKLEMLQSGESMLKPKHAGMFFENVMKKDGQQQHGDCMACGTQVASTGAFKWHSHTINCPLMPAAVKKPFKELREGTDSKRAAKREVAVVQQEEAQIASAQHAAKQVALKQQCLRAGIKNAETDAADKAIANFFYGNAIPFSAASAEQDSLYREMISAIKNAPPGYMSLQTPARSAASCWTHATRLCGLRSSHATLSL